MKKEKAFLFYYICTMINQTKQISIHSFLKGNIVANKTDVVAVEEPLEMIIAFGESSNRQRKSLSITMRTPTGHDFELAAGFLLTEGIITNFTQVLSMRYIANANENVDLQSNVLQIDLHARVPFAMEKLQRHFYTSSSCGVCGKTAIELVQQQSCYFLSPDFPKVQSSILVQLPKKLRSIQRLFEETGGIHAVALFDTEGNLLAIREDIGRHNALDKLLGFALKENLIPLRENILLLSGRISFELVQKAAIAGIPIIAAIGAPSSLAIELAAENNITLIGFLREERFNIYTIEGRVT
jgi:FdhD protein